MAVNSCNLTLAFMPDSLMCIEVVICPELSPIFDDTLKIRLLCDMLEILPCHVISEAHPSMVQDAISYDAWKYNTL